MKMLQRLQYSFSGEPIQAPKQDQIEFLFRSIEEQLFECSAVRTFASGMIHVLALYFPAFVYFLTNEGAKLGQLVFAILTLISGANSCIYNDFHAAEFTSTKNR